MKDYYSELKVAKNITMAVALLAALAATLMATLPAAA
jgi:hypothetical protein